MQIYIQKINTQGLFQFWLRKCLLQKEMLYLTEAIKIHFKNMFSSLLKNSILFVFLKLSCSFKRCLQVWTFSIEKVNRPT